VKNEPPYDTLKVARLKNRPLARYISSDTTPNVLDVDYVEVPVTHHAGPYHVADLNGLGEHSVVDVRTGGTDFRSTDYTLAVTVADTFHREGV
jgi:hypothetical protein